MTEEATNSKPGPTLIKAIAKVMEAVSEMPKEGRNDFHGYDYIKASDVMDVLRPIMARHSLVSIPSVVEHTTEKFEDKRGRVQWRTTLELEVMWTDGESSLTTRWVGVGEDAGDKSYYKAYTGALKYALLKTFCIGEGGADPEASHPNEQIDLEVTRPLADQVMDLLTEVVPLARARDFARLVATASTGGRTDRLEEVGPGALEKLVTRLKSHQGDARDRYIREAAEKMGNAG